MVSSDAAQASGPRTASPVSAAELDQVIEDTARELLPKHLARSKEWFPHQLVAADLAPCELEPGVASAVWVNLLTEDNLPGYYHAVASAFGFDSAMGEWSRRWAAEEQRHAIVMRDWVCRTGALDPIALERARMAQVSAGFRPAQRGQSVSDGVVYLALQELATRVSHWNTGDRLDAAGMAVMRRVAADENLHHLFYRDLVSAALRADPSGTVMAIDRQVSTFEMPGAGIAGFSRHAAAIAAAGIYDFGVHYRQIVLPLVVVHWQLESVEGLNDAAEAARDHVVARIARLRRVAERAEEQAAQREPTSAG